MVIRTLNQIINELKEIANQHLQINSFNAGTLDDFATSGDTRYPAMWVSYENAAISSRTESYSFSIWIVDRVKKDRSNLIEVHSDCKSILNDIKAQVMNPGYGWVVGQDWNYQAIFEPFMEDEVAGWLADITITQPFSNDTCQIPFNQEPIPGLASTQPTNGSVISSYVPTSRIITINGVSYDLQFNRTWEFRCYGSFYDTTTQQVTANGIAALKFDSTDTDVTFGVSIVNDSQITVNKDGVYNIQFSAQLQRFAGGQPKRAVFWLRKNGVDVPNTSTIITLQANNDYLVAAWNFFVQLNNGEYAEIMWTQDDDIRLVAEPENLIIPYPEIPSIILTVNKIN